jgi:hypothetical protein
MNDTVDYKAIVERQRKQALERQKRHIAKKLSAGYRRETVFVAEGRGLVDVPEDIAGLVRQIGKLYPEDCRARLLDALTKIAPLAVRLDQIKLKDGFMGRPSEDRIALIARQIEKSGRAFRPLQVWASGEGFVLLDGLHRFLAAERLAIAELPCSVLRFASEGEAKEYAKKSKKKILGDN